MSEGPILSPQVHPEPTLDLTPGDKIIPGIPAPIPTAGNPGPSPIRDANGYLERLPVKMVDPIVDGRGNLIAPDTGYQSVDDTSYKGSVARKKVAWAISKLLAAKIIAWASLPAVLAAWGSFTAWLQAHGVTIVIDQKAFALALPGTIFGLFVLGHDWAKVQYPNLTWL